MCHYIQTERFHLDNHERQHALERELERELERQRQLELERQRQLERELDNAIRDINILFRIILLDLQFNFEIDLYLMMI